MDIRFSTYNDFLTEYKTYRLDKCSKCKGVRELNNLGLIEPSVRHG